jgi:hypothetical protein
MSDPEKTFDISLPIKGTLPDGKLLVLAEDAQFILDTVSKEYLKQNIEVLSLREQLAQTQKQLVMEQELLASAKTPNMFWDAENPEECQFDVRDVFESYFCESTELGLQVVIKQAVSVPDTTYKLIELNDDGTFEIEKLKAEGEVDERE